MRFIDRLFPVGTRSVLFGAHCWFIHPFFVAWAWKRLYGFPLDPRLYAAFFLHDLGYFGCREMDGPEGERHVEFGAAVMHFLFDYRTGPEEYASAFYGSPGAAALEDSGWVPRGDVPPVVSERGELLVGYVRRERSTRWRDFSLYHSRFYAKRDGKQPSRLCAADKLATALEPWWLYLPRVIASGEIKEYMEMSRSAALGRAAMGGSKYSGEPQCTTADEVKGLGPRRAWHRVMSNYCRAWALEHADGKKDRWTAGRTVSS